MRKTKNHLLFYSSAVLAGGASLMLHRYMMDTCFDAKGLLIAGNWPGRLLIVIGAAFGIGLLLLLRTLGGNGSYEDNFPQNAVSGGLLMAAGLVMLWTALHPEQDALSQTQAVAGELGAIVTRFIDGGRQLLPWLAAASMVVLGLCRIQGRHAPAWFAGLVCLYYMLTLVSDYRLWSADPQVQDYAYQLLAEVLLMLCAFHRTSCDGGILQRKKLIFTGLAAAMCSMAALSMDFHRPFFLASTLWGLGCICSTAILPPDPEEEPEQPEPASE